MNFPVPHTPHAILRRPLWSILTLLKRTKRGRGLHTCRVEAPGLDNRGRLLAKVRPRNVCIVATEPAPRKREAARPGPTSRLH